MNIQISEHFTYKKLLRFTLPSIIMMVFTSIYGVIDGFFVSNFVGKTPFAAVNFIMPFLMILGAVGFMFGTGGSALISKTNTIFLLASVRHGTSFIRSLQGQLICFILIQTALSPGNCYRQGKPAAA